MLRFPAVVVTSVLGLFLSTTFQAQDSNRTPERQEGTAPRASATKYRAHAEQKGFSIGAERLTKKQVVTTFAANVHRCCLVIQVAVYPKKDEPADLALADFALTQVGTDIPIRPESATVIAARLEKDKNSGKNTAYPHGSVGYEWGTYSDPVTGQPIHGHRVGTNVGVATGPGSTVPPGVADHEREVMQRELEEKGLPEAKVSIPVAGYLYFPIQSRKDAKYELTYSGSAEPIILALP